MARTVFYLDTCIWRDFYESRFGPKGRPLGDYAAKLFMKIISNKDILLFSEFVARELKKDFSEKEVNEMLSFLFTAGILRRVDASEEDYKEAKRIALERNLPLFDVLHALIARNNNAVFVSQDAHFLQLKDIVEVRKPEQVL